VQFPRLPEATAPAVQLLPERGTRASLIFPCRVWSLTEVMLDQISARAGTSQRLQTNSGSGETGRTINPAFFTGLECHRPAASLLVWKAGAGTHLTSVMQHELQVCNVL